MTMPLRSKITGSLDFPGWPIELIARHFEKRLSELVGAVASLSVGLLLLFSPLSLENSAYRYVDYYGVGSHAAELAFLSIGIARIVALALNGHWMPGGGYTRAVFAGVGAAMWAQLAAGLWWYGMEPNHFLDLSFPILVTLALADVVSVYRALTGLRRWKAHGKAD